MTNKNYQSGRNFEYRVKKYLEKKGYYVIRSAGSKGQIDIIAVPTYDDITLLPETLLIQCKHGAKISKKERDELLKLEYNICIDGICIVAWSKPYGKLHFFAWKTVKLNDGKIKKWGEIKI